MPKLIKEWTAVQVSRLREPGRYVIGGAQGLMLRITETGARLWVCRLMVDGKRRDIGLGRHGEVSLSQARDAARALRLAVRRGEFAVREKPASAPPAPVRCFEQAAREFIEAKQQEWRNAKHRAQWFNTLQTYAFPTLDKMSVADVALAHVLAVLQPVWVEKTETANRVRGRIEAVLDYASVQGWRTGDNSARWKGLLDKVLPAPGKLKKNRHHAAMPADDAPAFMQKLQGMCGAATLALQLLVLTAARSGEVRGARWDEFNVATAVWTIPADRMKAAREHQVPLSLQALDVLANMPRIENRTDLLFPNIKGSGMMSDMAMTQLMRRMQLGYVPHGFRSTFRDWAGDNTDYPRDLLEAALAHTLQNKVEAAYRRKTALERRRVLMQDWADFLLPRGNGAM